MRFARIPSIVLALAALGVPAAVSAQEPVPTSPVFMDSLPKPKPRFAEAPRVDLITGTRLQNPAAGAVKVDRFEFVGASVVPVAELQARVASYAGRMLASTDIDAAAEEVAKLYRSRGYPLAAAALAAPVAGGVARIQVYEGRLGAIRVEGNSRYAEEALLYPTADLPRGKPLTNAELEGALLKLDDLPGLDVRGQGLPARVAGETDLVIAADETTFQFGIAADNNGVESVGRQRYRAQFRYNSLAGWGDELAFEVFNSEQGGSYYGRIDYSVPVDTDAVAGVSYAIGKYEAISEGLSGQDIEGDTTELRAFWSVATARSRALSREWRFSFQRLEGQTFANGGTVELEESALYDYGVGVFDSSWNSDGTGWTRSFEFDTNFESNPTGTETRANLGQFRFAGSLLVNNGSWQTLVKGRAVYSFDPAAPMKQFRIGGPNSVRAYDYAQEVGDGGFDASVEFLAPLRSADGMRNQLAFFADVGYAAYHQTPSVTSVEALIGGVGVGWRVSSRLFDLAIDYAYPVGTHSTPDGDENGYLWAKASLGF